MQIYVRESTTDKEMIELITYPKEIEYLYAVVHCDMLDNEEFGGNSVTKGSLLHSLRNGEIIVLNLTR